MIIPGNIDDWFCYYQSCECVAGVFEESVCEDRDADNTRDEDIPNNVHDFTLGSISGNQGISGKRISISGYQGINKKHIGNQIIRYENHFFAPFFFLTQLI